MLILVSALRLIHIVAAFAWFGMGLTTTYITVPAAAAAGGEVGYRYFKSMLTRTAYSRLIPVVAGVTTLAGIILVLTGSLTYFSTVGKIVLGIGAIAGLAAAVHGGAVTGRAAREYAALLSERVPDDKPIPADALPVLREQAMVIASHSRVSFILMAVALIGMASARYL